MKNFTFARLPKLHFGAGTFISSLESELKNFRVRRLAVITGKGSFRRSPAWEALFELLRKESIAFTDYSFSGEPSPDFVDHASAELRAELPDAVLAVGGGSVMDAGKAIAAMIRAEGSVQDYLEGVGTREPAGEKVPMIAVPTTSGTGSEATKNAVISRIGPDGFKKSLRHDAYVPDVALIDPELILSCPPAVTAASGLDAITQLLEAFVSTDASPITDALARSGLERAGKSFSRAFEDGSDVEARAEMAYAAYLSGVCLANAGLGVVHGIASPLGAYRDIPHGVVCGTLLASSVNITVERLLEEDGENSPALAKYAEAGRLLSGADHGTQSHDVRALIDTLEMWTVATGISTLGRYDISSGDAVEIAAQSGLKNHPARLSREDIADIIRERI